MEILRKISENGMIFHRNSEKRAFEEVANQCELSVIQRVGLPALKTLSGTQAS